MRCWLAVKINRCSYTPGIMLSNRISRRSGPTRYSPNIMAHKNFSRWVRVRRKDSTKKTKPCWNVCYVTLFELTLPQHLVPYRSHRWKRGWPVQLQRETLTLCDKAPSTKNALLTTLWSGEIWKDSDARNVISNQYWQHYFFTKHHYKWKTAFV